MPALTFPVLGVAPCRPYTDDELVAALRAGDASAVTPFLSRFYRLAFAIADRRSPNAHIHAWDALSDLALELLAGRHRHARIYSAQGYVATAVMHHVFAALRREHRLRKRIDTLETMECAKVGQAMSQATYRAARGGTFDVSEDAPAKPLPAFLAPSELEMMTWIGDGWTQQQVADELHIERDTAKKRIARLRRRMQATYVA